MVVPLLAFCLKTLFKYMHLTPWLSGVHTHKQQMSHNGNIDTSVFPLHGYMWEIRRFVFRNVFHPTCPCSQCNTRSNIIVHTKDKTGFVCFQGPLSDLWAKRAKGSVLPDAGLNICASACVHARQASPWPCVTSGNQHRHMEGRRTRTHPQPQTLPFYWDWGGCMYSLASPTFASFKCLSKGEVDT